MPPSSRPNGVERVAQEGDNWHTGMPGRTRLGRPVVEPQRLAFNLVRGLGKRPAAASPPLVMRMPWWSVRSASCAASEQIAEISGLFSGLGDITPELGRLCVGPKCKCPVPPK